ncbi:MAG TPA: dihydrodipicolinate reductase C-terminal domain-containing protein [Thermomicrobiales bacterium]|nr:dihydrodipicolinate reductase C-terminal domain-containing protein [Thermomicrobiales bacterium]
MAVPIRVGLVGASGRMGREISLLAESDPEVTISGGVGRETAGSLGALVREIDVLVDFSTPDGTLAAVAVASDAGLPLVTGTTGLSDAQVDTLREASIVIPVWYARNMSTGVSLLQRILPEIARALAGYDIELMEMHHRHKVDAPSGTALMLVEAIERGLVGEGRHKVGNPTESAIEVGGMARSDSSQVRNDSVAGRVFGREGHAPRQPGEIGIHAIRGGGNVGEHTIIFASDEEEIRIAHRAYSRAAFAAGAIRAAKSIHGQPPGWFGPE